MTTGDCASAESGGPTAATGVRENGLTTSGKPESSRSWRSSAGSLRAASGITSSTPASTRESRRPLVRVEKLVEDSGSAISQAATTTATACTPAPSVESTLRVPSPRIRSRMNRPR